MIKIFTDGACQKNPGPGGYAALIVGKGVAIWVKGRAESTTNNRMEMLAALRALEATPEKSDIILTSDSQYLIHGFSRNWVTSWKKKNWITKKRQPVLNADLWKRLDELASKRNVFWQWVRGHNGHVENEACDEAAVEALFTADLDPLGEKI